MSGIRELLTIVLGVVLGIVLLTAPRVALRLSVVVGPSRRHRGDYGTDASVSNQWIWIIRGLGVVCISIATYITFKMYGSEYLYSIFG